MFLQSAHHPDLNKTTMQGCDQNSRVSDEVFSMDRSLRIEQIFRSMWCGPHLDELALWGTLVSAQVDLKGNALLQ